MQRREGREQTEQCREEKVENTGSSAVKRRERTERAIKGKTRNSSAVKRRERTEGKEQREHCR